VLRGTEPACSQAENWPRVEALFEQALWLQQRGGAGADGAVSLLYQYATVQYVRWARSLVCYSQSQHFHMKTIL